MSLAVVITTVNDDARADSEIWLSIPAMGFTACLKPSNNANPSPVCQNGPSATDQNARQEWPNGSTDPSPQNFGPLTMSAPVLPAVNIQLISHNHGFENDDNWEHPGEYCYRDDARRDNKNPALLSRAHAA